MRWGGALLELAHYRQGEEAIQYIQDVSPAQRQEQAAAEASSGSSRQR